MTQIGRHGSQGRMSDTTVTPGTERHGHLLLSRLDMPLVIKAAEATIRPFYLISLSIQSSNLLNAAGRLFNSPPVDCCLGDNRAIPAHIVPLLHDFYVRNHFLISFKSDWTSASRLRFCVVS